MSRLQLFAEDAPEAPLLDTDDVDVIAREVATIGVTFERWPLRALPGNADNGAILAAYAPEIDRLKAQGGYRAVDTIALRPDHPDRAALRTKFLAEHRHSEDEVRFFVAGAGLFTLHEGGRVFNVLTCAGDLMRVPAGVPHWFDMGAAPDFTAIRLFIDPAGWVAQPTGSAIAERFPRHEPA